MHYYYLHVVIYSKVKPVCVCVATMLQKTKKKV